MAYEERKKRFKGFYDFEKTFKYSILQILYTVNKNVGLKKMSNSLLLSCMCLFVWNWSTEKLLKYDVHLVLKLWYFCSISKLTIFSKQVHTGETICKH